MVFATAHLDAIYYILAIALWRRIADGRTPSSLATRMRRHRFSLFLELLETIPRPVSLLDVGGTPSYWKHMGFTDAGVAITILNISPQPDPTSRQIQGDARTMTQFSDNEFDVVYSNSVIEHVGTRKDQQAAADEIRRVGKRYFVQTPNYWFPVEPHFLVPGFQLLPIRWRALLLERFNLGHIRRQPDFRAAEDTVRSIELLTATQLQSMFPGAVLYRERFFGMTKSLMAAGGWGYGLQ
jgi:hypothetical protein